MEHRVVDAPMAPLLVLTLVVANLSVHLRVPDAIIVTTHNTGPITALTHLGNVAVVVVNVDLVLHVAVLLLLEILSVEVMALIKKSILQLSHSIILKKKSIMKKKNIMKKKIPHPGSSTRETFEED